MECMSDGERQNIPETHPCCSRVLCFFLKRQRQSDDILKPAVLPFAPHTDNNSNQINK